MSQRKGKKEYNVFVTVGTTKFEKFIRVFDTEEYINEADLIIGHAGVGTIVETLRANKPLLVIVNQDLMDNHQQEVASGLEKKGYINVAYPETLLETLKTKDVFHAIKYPPVDYNAFPNVGDEEMEL